MKEAEIIGSPGVLSYAKKTTSIVGYYLFVYTRLYFASSSKMKRCPTVCVALTRPTRVFLKNNATSVGEDNDEREIERERGEGKKNEKLSFTFR